MEAIWAPVVRIRRVEAIFIRGPYGICSGWSTYEQCRSEEIQDVR